MYPHVDPTEIDRFPKLKDGEEEEKIKEEEEKNMEEADKKHEDLFKDDRGIKEKHLLNGGLMWFNVFVHVCICVCVEIRYVCVFV